MTATLRYSLLIYALPLLLGAMHGHSFAKRCCAIPLPRESRRLLCHAVLCCAIHCLCFAELSKAPPLRCMAVHILCCAMRCCTLPLPRLAMLSLCAATLRNSLLLFAIPLQSRAKQRHCQAAQLLAYPLLGGAKRSFAVAYNTS